MSNHALNHNNFQPYTQIKYLICNSNVKHFCPNMTFRIFTLARRLPDGARMLIRIINWRSAIQNWRLKIEHVQRIKVDRDDSPILVEWTLASSEPPASQFTCLLWFCRPAKVKIKKEQTNNWAAYPPHSPGCSQFASQLGAVHQLLQLNIHQTQEL